MYSMRMRYAVPITIVISLAGAVVCAQEPVKPAANVDVLFRDSNKKLNEIKQVAYHIEKDLLQCNHWNEAEKWLTDRYIQHNPLVVSGRAVYAGWQPIETSLAKPLEKGASSESNICDPEPPQNVVAGLVCKT